MKVILKLLKIELYLKEYLTITHLLVAGAEFLNRGVPLQLAQLFLILKILLIMGEMLSELVGSLKQQEKYLRSSLLSKFTLVK